VITNPVYLSGYPSCSILLRILVNNFAVSL